MSLSRMFAGRKKESCVWNWFEYKPDVDKSICLAKGTTNDDTCGFKLCGKNSTNLKNHLSRMHPALWKETQDAVKTKVEKKASTSISANLGNQSQSQTLEECVARRTISWPVDSAEHKQRLSSLLSMVVATGSPVTIADNNSFRDLMKTMDPKFKMPASAKISSLLKDQMLTGVSKLRSLLSLARRVTICLDGWSKKGLTASYLGISACFFDPSSNKPQHALLNLDLIQHPHTGEMLASCIEKCLSKWGIEKEKVILVVSDNGANMVKAIRLVKESFQNEYENDINQFEDDEESNETYIIQTGAEDHDDDYGEPLELIVDYVTFKRLGCLPHTIQLVVKVAYNGTYSDVISKTRTLVGKVRKSSVAMEMVINKCGKVVISDNTTRWNSTYIMAKRLLEIKVALNEVLIELNIDTLLTSEWVRLEELVTLLEPFASQTDILQTDSLSLSNIIPSILDLECHLEQFPSAKPLTKTMLTQMRDRFSVLLQPSHPEFNPLPAAACLLDPSVASFILGFDQAVLREAAKEYILSQTSVVITPSSNPVPVPCTTTDDEPPRKRWKFLSAKQLAGVTPLANTLNTTQAELSKYLIEIRNSLPVADSLNFWLQRRCIYPQLASLAEDLLCAPASQAFVERIFSLCGLLSAGRRNRMHKSLEMRVFLKLNAHLL